VRTGTDRRWIAWILLAAVVAGAAWLAARLGGPEPPSRGPTTTVDNTQGWPRTLVERFPDGRESRRIALPAPPQRIVSVTLAADEILIDMVGPDRIAALSLFADRPGWMRADGVSEIDRFVGADPESIVALRPDLCFLADYNRETLRSLLIESGVPVFVFRSHRTFGDIRRNIRLIGRAVGAESDAERLVAAMDAKIASVAAQLPPRDAWPTAMVYGPGGWAAGTGTTQTELFEAAGLRNAVAEAGIEGSVKLGEERVLGLAPDYFVVATGPAGIAHQKEWLLRNPALKPLRAVREKRFLELDGALLASASHYVADAVVALALEAYPDRFAAPETTAPGRVNDAD
jgi:iron complex transport system substrate-binding protein